RILKPLEQKKFAGVLLVEGSTGVGKTRFLNNAREIFSDKLGLNWVGMRCDDLISYSFKPFTEYLKLYFKTESPLTENLKSEEVEKKFNDLLSKLENEKLRSNLSFGKIFLSALIGLENSTAVYSMYDAKAVYDNTLSALKNFFLALSTLSKLVIEIEDTNWMDSDSVKLINFMVQNIENYPFLIVLSYRPTRALQDEITTDKLNKITLLEFEKDDSRFYVKRRIEELAENRNFVPRGIVEKIIEITEGNPLFMEQIILFLKNKGKLDTADNLTVEEFEFPSDINSLIISRIDLLKYKLKNLVKIASVLGKDFDTQILSWVSSQADIFTFLLEGEKESIWAPRSDFYYTFLHSMIRECVYRMQLKKDLVDLHQKTGEVIEKIYGDRIEEKFEELSYHYHRAENSSKSVFYLYKSAEKLRLKYRYSDASSYYEKLIYALLPRGEESFVGPELEDTAIMSIDGRLSVLKEETQLERILIKAAEIERFLGDWQKADKYYRFAIKYAEKNKDMHLYYVSKRHLGRHLLSKGEYEEAQKILKEAELHFTSNHLDKELADVFGDFGFLFASQGDYAKALDYYDLQKSLYEKVKDEKGLSQVMLDQGVVFWRQGFMDKAMQAFRKQLEIAQKIQDKRLYARAIGNIGLVHAMKGELEQAKDSLQENLKVMKELGDRVELSKTFGNLGVLNKDMGNLTEAERLFDQKLSVVKELGDRAEIQQVTTNIGILKMQGGDVKMAKKHLVSALKMSNSLKDEKGKAFILSSLGQLYYKIGDLQKTIDNYQKSLEISRTIGDQTGVFSCLGNIGTSYLELGKDKKALKYLKKQLLEAKKTGVDRNLMYAMINLGIVHGKLKDLRSARKYLKSAQKIALGLKNDKFSKEINVYLANAEISSKKYKSAEKRLKEVIRVSHDQETEIEAETMLLRLKNLSKSSPGELIENIKKLTGFKNYPPDKKIKAHMLYEITKSMNRIRKKPELLILSVDEDFISQCLYLTGSRKKRGFLHEKPDRILFLFAEETYKFLKTLNRERSTKDLSKKTNEMKKVLERTKDAVIKKK
ncbi:tetratricopeptide repeat protein, partial [candidate division WOR-3 bacterium]|nr:tetratricopeptide repeat protein [candidate division WOR-3 bacterium]